MSRLLFYVFCLTLVANEVGATPIVAYDNLSPSLQGSPQFSPGSYLVGPEPMVGGLNFISGVSFVPTQTGSLDSLVVAMNTVYQQSEPVPADYPYGDLTFSIFSDDNGKIDKNLWQETYNNVFIPLWGTQYPEFTSIGGPILNSNSTYWLVAASSSPKNIIWLDNTLGEKNTTAVSVNGSDFSYYSDDFAPAFTLGVTTSVPEFSNSLLLMLPGLFMLLVMKIKRAHKQLVS